ncbi:hypothetical protein C486_15984 [Natrinema gari JCM 14663]|uniref:Uncharacterized protein n=1 Tax=Natrinema gari JCM 14663 TaxID=1230459 RepID=L9YU17_9EURY|nr:hypothetical protein C486_15984 [Natrinema gari JCM 14663]
MSSTSPTRLITDIDLAKAGVVLGRSDSAVIVTPGGSDSRLETLVGEGGKTIDRRRTQAVLVQWVHYYNRRRLRQVLDGKTPIKEMQNNQ